MTDPKGLQGVAAARKVRDCQCDECVSACKRTPGWFAPGEAQKAAKLMGLPWEEFRDKYLIQDYWAGEDTTHVWSPRKVGVDEGRKVASFSSAWHRAPCVFLDKRNRCRIHAAKPLECRAALSCGGEDGARIDRFKIVQMYQRRGNPVLKEGVAEEPEAPTFGDILFGGLLGMLPGDGEATHNG